MRITYIAISFHLLQKRKVASLKSHVWNLNETVAMGCIRSQIGKIWPAEFSHIGAGTMEGFKASRQEAVGRL